VLLAMQKNRVNATHFAATTGYGYNDDGRETLEKVYADVFHTEAALVRPQITCGTHALAVALSANLLPGDELLSPVGAPYDTLEEVIGIRESRCSLKEYGVTYAQADLKADGAFDLDAIRAAVNPAQSSSPFSAPRATPPAPPSAWSRSAPHRLLQVPQARRQVHGGQLLRRICGDAGALGCGGRHGGGQPHQKPRRRPGPHRRLYLRHQSVHRALRLSLSAPGLGQEVGANLGLLPAFYQGLFLAPTVVSGALKGAVFAAGVL
jgi:cystathionine beta-lyase family protein involved in aluminum resistance